MDVLSSDNALLSERIGNLEAGWRGREGACPGAEKRQLQRESVESLSKEDSQLEILRPTLKNRPVPGSVPPSFSQPSQGKEVPANHGDSRPVIYGPETKAPKDRPCETHTCYWNN